MRHVMFDTDAAFSSPSPSSSDVTTATATTTSSSPPPPPSGATTSQGQSQPEKQNQQQQQRRRHALSFGRSKINLHESGREFEPKAALPGPGTADLCFLITEDVEGLPARFEAAGVEVLWHDVNQNNAAAGANNDSQGKPRKGEAARDQGEEANSSSPSTAVSAGSPKNGKGRTAVVTRTGARGTLRSVYLRDPDGNLIELSNYKTTHGKESEVNEDEYEDNVDAEGGHDVGGVVPTPS
ncbi:uncharacterized protein B0I36DRAFT_325133 [Microdochium trichocladiopsis]|uniref:VOC domain-containing protein n=1 Tax=Microdochium trichocladiopsis TaxID=1682393 RepID=A0A9P8Y4C4_9PEZI|nr:uncharacterized protein B0I36DRAFT_325133 [Microdochium trichocladiopsis]KAH7029149.1 hypothetical protein B0I36DRAFT_325133 [Microdochium trichocladiopsis]